MPACSLWLLPPKHSPIRNTLSSLISDTLPTHFAHASPPTFVPHVTLTSDIPTAVFSHALDEPQQKRDARVWLDELELPLRADGAIATKFEALDVGESFVKKLTLRVEKEGVRELAFRARMYGVEKGAPHKAEEWVNMSYSPHCSLVYGEMPISDEKKAELQMAIEDAGIDINGSGQLGGWKGGVVWLVPTFKKIPDWEPWAEKAL